MLSKNRRAVASVARSPLSRDNLDENGGGNQGFEAAAGGERMIIWGLNIRKHFFGPPPFDCR